VVPEVLAVLDDPPENALLLGLERESWNLLIPLDQ